MQNPDCSSARPKRSFNFERHVQRDVSPHPPGVVPTPSQVVLKRDGGEDEESQSFGNILSIDDYDTTKRFMVRAALETCAVDPGNTEGLTPEQVQRHQSVRAACARASHPGIEPAAVTNHLIRVVEDGLQTDGDVVSRLTPYTTAQASAFARNFISRAIEVAPLETFETLPSVEMRSASKPLTREYIQGFQRSAYPGEPRCRNGDSCWGRRLLDSSMNPIVGTTWRVFWFPEELLKIQSNSSVYEKEASSRVCIGCKFEQANKRVNGPRHRNNCVANNILLCDAHVLVNVPGEYPVEATLGCMSNGYNGLVCNIPRMSLVGWTAEADSKRSSCYTYQDSIPAYPIPREFYDRDLEVGQGF